MQTLIGWALIIWPAGVLLQSLVGVAIAAMTGGYAEGEAGEALLLLGMGAVVALLPIGLGIWLVQGPRRARPDGTGLPPPRRSTRELVGWALTVPGIAVGTLWLAAPGGSGGSRTLAGVVQAAVLCLLLATGVVLVVAERRRARSIRDHLAGPH